MNWFKEAQFQYKGYKVVGFNPSTQQFYSIYDKSPYQVSVGKSFYNPKGFYLGTTRQFCTDYYLCGTEDEHDEYILTFSFSDKDILKGDPSAPNSEVLVMRGTIIDLEKINKEEWC